MQTNTPQKRIIKGSTKFFVKLLGRLIMLTDNSVKGYWTFETETSYKVVYDFVGITDQELKEMGWEVIAT